MLIFEKYGDEHWASEFCRLSQIYRQLADDLDLLARGGSPSEKELRRSPRIDCYRMTFRSSPCLTGELSGHPILSPVEREVVTSELIAYAPKLKLARTRSRWYRLGTLASELQGERK